LVDFAAKYLKKMADRGVTQKLLRLGAVTTADKHVQEAALSTLLTLASVPENRQRLCEEPGLIAMCCDLIGDPEDHVDRLRLIACDIICCIAFEDQQRYKIMQQHPQVLAALRKQLDRSHESVSVVHHAQRALSALGDPFVLDKFSRKPLTSSFSRTEKDGIRVICIDGGGTRGYVTVLFLAHIEKALGRKICELFDLIVGTSTGSIIASLAMQGISMEQMMPLYRDLSRRAFVPYGAKTAEMGPISVPRGTSISFAHAPVQAAAMSPSSPDLRASQPNLGSSPLSNVGILARSPGAAEESPLDANAPFNLNTALGKGLTVPPATGASSISSYLLGGTMERLVSMTNVLRSKGYYSTKPFVKVLKDLAGGKSVRLIDTAVTSQIKLAIVSCECSKVPVESFVFRNYSFPSAERSSRYRGDCEALLWQAMRASSAAPGYYDEFWLGNYKFIDGGVGANNPSAVAYHEARRLWPDRSIDLLLSCGNGIMPHKKSENTLSQLMLNIIDVATETEKTHQLISNFFNDDTYIRIQPVDEAFDWSLDECRSEKFDTLEVAVDKFVAANSLVIRRICEKLAGVRAPPPSPTL
jgi:predicted acylesterase/phospholipase RssA